MDSLIAEQRRLADQNGQNLTDEELREEVVAEACQSFFARKTVVADIQALKTKNKGLWSALKRFFSRFYTKLNKVYESVDPDTWQGKYMKDARNKVKSIRDAFLEGAVAASKNAAKTSEAIKKTSAKSQKKDINHKFGDDIKGITSYSEKEISSIESNKNFAVANSTNDIITFFEEAINDTTNANKTMFIGKISARTASKIHSFTGLNAENKSIAINSSDLRHMIKKHGNQESESKRGQEVINSSNFMDIIQTIADPDVVSSDVDSKSGVISVIFKKEINGRITAITVFSEKKRAFTLKTARITKKEQHSSQPINAKALTSTPKAKSSMNAVSNNSISQSSEKVNKKILHKSRTVTAEQDAAYIDAIKRGDMKTAQKMVDEAAKVAGYTYNGAHGTSADFNNFDYSYIGDDNKLGLGFYFTNNEKLQFKYDYEKTHT